MLPPVVGLLAWSILLVILLRYDSAEANPSRALWVPLIWLSIMGSRLPAQWLGMTPTSATTAFEEGSGLDRTVYLVLIVLAVGILARRNVNWSGVLESNPALTLFLLFGLASIVWSDYPFITFKRWIRDIGMYLMLLVVVSDPQPIEAISTIIRRLTYVLLIVSVALIKYYPDTGVLYNQWTGSPEYVGATTTKNMLGVLCLISGLFYFWDTLRRWSERNTRYGKRVLIVNIALIAITLWLINLSESATSRACLVIGCLIIVIVRSRWAKVNPGRLTMAIPVALAVYFILDFAFDFRALIAQLLGRDPSLTGRTGMWDVLLAVQSNPLLGVGYQSFWLGDRLATVLKRLDASFLNEAHNGYLEIYLSLGLVGLALIGVLMVSSYRTVFRQLRTSPHFASLSLALWVIMVFYNFTEAAFAASLLWSVMLLCVIVVPRAPDKVPSATRAPIAKAHRLTGHRSTL